MRGRPDPATGYVLDLGELKRILERAVVGPCDHRNLNKDVDFLRGRHPDDREPGRRLLGADRAAHQGRAAAQRPPLRDAAQFRRVPRTRGDGMSKKKPMYLHASSSGAPRRRSPAATTTASGPPRSTARRCPTSWTPRTARSRARTCRSSRSASRTSSCRSSSARRRAGSSTLEASVTGTVSLEAELKGINMSRIVRSFYDHKAEVFTGERVGRILKSYLRRVESKDARLKLGLLVPDAPEEPAQRAGGLPVLPGRLRGRDDARRRATAGSSTSTSSTRRPAPARPSWPSTPATRAASTRAAFPAEQGAPDARGGRRAGRSGSRTSTPSACARCRRRPRSW